MSYFQVLCNFDTNNISLFAQIKAPLFLDFIKKCKILSNFIMFKLYIVGYFLQNSCNFDTYNVSLFAKIKGCLMERGERGDWKRNIKFRREGLLLPPPLLYIANIRGKSNTVKKNEIFCKYLPVYLLEAICSIFILSSSVVVIITFCYH